MDRIEPTCELISEEELDRRIAKYDQMIEREERLAELRAEREEYDEDDDDQYADRRGAAQKLADTAAWYAQGRMIAYGVVMVGVVIWHGTIEFIGYISEILSSF